MTQKIVVYSIPKLKNLISLHPSPNKITISDNEIPETTLSKTHIRKSYTNNKKQRMKLQSRTRSMNMFITTVLLCGFGRCKHLLTIWVKHEFHFNSNARCKKKPCRQQKTTQKFTQISCFTFLCFYVFFCILQPIKNKMRNQLTF